MPPGVFCKAVIERQGRHIEAKIGRALDVGMTAENVGAATGMADVASSEQQNATCPHVRRPDAELRLAHRPDQRCRAFFGKYFGDVLDLCRRQTCDALDLVGRPLVDLLADLVEAVNSLADEFLVLPAVFENMPKHAVDGRNMRTGANADIVGRMR